MGWSELAGGLLSGDQPGDTVGDGLRAIADEARRRGEALPTGAAILGSLLAALNLDGSEAPFYADPRRLKAIVAGHDGRLVRIEEDAAVPFLVQELYTTLEDVAADYQAAWSRPPQLRELLHYFSLHLRELDLLAEISSEATPWDLDAGRFVFLKGGKPRRRSSPPTVSPPAPRSLGQVRHPKFGVGDILEVRGDRLTVNFGGENRVVLRSFVTDV